MKTCYERALELREETVAHRRYFHENAEVGLDLPKARAYVKAELKKLGLEPKDCGYGVTATIGRGGKCILLRADMDACPCRKKAARPLRPRIPMRPTPAAMISMPPCC